MAPDAAHGTGPASPAGAIVTASTRLAEVPSVPGIVLYQADEPFAVWERTETAAGRDGLPPPFWAFAWAGGQALARYLLDHPALVAGCRVLDVAAGSGLLAVVAARSGAAQVTAVDVDELAIAAIAANAAANGVEVTPVLADLLAGPVPAADVLLCGDAFYEKDLAERMLAFLERARARGTRVLAGDPGRAFLPAGRLTPLASYEIPVTRALEGMTVKRATVYEVPGSP
ncbi:MAG TPA: 50S ribosomal protein L11 methyltransferase [Streptosporangiaceae bacterium]|nr:50S ribosomal protein L11 methyltransferase [Streptosporangiaceae bacterium]